MLIALAWIIFIGGYLSTLLPPASSRYLVLACALVQLALLRAMYRSWMREEMGTVSKTGKARNDVDQSPARSRRQC